MDILFEDKYVVIINKPAGLMVEPDAHGYPNLADQVSAYRASNGPDKTPFVQPVHRIDRPVSGIVLFALKPSALKNLNAQFADRRVKKTYLAITAAKPETDKGILKHYHRKDPMQKIAVISDHPKKGMLPAELEYEIVENRDGYFLWKIHLLTGRYHQIRAQLAHIRCPILGDAKYGSAHSYLPDSIALHAFQLEFYHPQTHELMKVEAPLPQSLVWKLFY